MNASNMLVQAPTQPLTRDQVLAQWLEAKAALEGAKEREMSLRKEAVAMFADPAIKEATQVIPLANGYKLKAKFPLSYSLDQSLIDQAVEDLENYDEFGKFVADRLVKYKADISITEYKALSDAHKKIIDKVLTIKDAAPTLELVEPLKGKK